MIEGTKSKAVDKSPERIRPPDGEEEHAGAWFESLAVPKDLPMRQRWLSVEEIRKMERMRRATVIQAMQRGELPFEQRGRIRYARLTDVIAWEERRLRGERKKSGGLLHPDLAGLA